MIILKGGKKIREVQLWLFHDCFVFDDLTMVGKIKLQLRIRNVRDCLVPIF